MLLPHNVHRDRPLAFVLERKALCPPATVGATLNDPNEILGVRTGMISQSPRMIHSRTMSNSSPPMNGQQIVTRTMSGVRASPPAARQHEKARQSRSVASGSR